MSRDNPLWGAPRIHGELLKLEIDVGEKRVWLAKGSGSFQSAWRTLQGIETVHMWEKSPGG